jgi:hypothetical protein
VVRTGSVKIPAVRVYQAAVMGVVANGDFRSGLGGITEHMKSENPELRPPSLTGKL